MKFTKKELVGIIKICDAIRVKDGFEDTIISKIKKFDSGATIRISRARVNQHMETELMVSSDKLIDNENFIKDIKNLIHVEKLYGDKNHRDIEGRNGNGDEIIFELGKNVSRITIIENK